MTDPGEELRRQREAAESYGVAPASPSPSPPPPPPGVVVRKQRGAVAPALLVLACLLGFVVLRDPSVAGTRLRQLVGGQSRVAPMVAVPQGPGRYKFTDHQADGGPVSYDPCRSIHYEINPQGAPDGYRDIVQTAIRVASQASGFDFVYDGTTDRRRFDQGAVSSAGASPVLVIWATPQEVPRLKDDVIGLGGSAAVERGGRRVYVTGGIALDRDEFAALASRHDTAEEQAIVMHELGHVLGLAHVHDDGELMNAVNVGRTSFGKGDLQGLALLGRVPCS